MRYTLLLGALSPLLLTASANPDPPQAKEGLPKPLLTLRGHTFQVIRVEFSPDGRRLATAAGDKTAALWDAATGKRLLTLKGHTEYVSGLAFSPDGKLLATASGDLTVKIWNTTTGRDVQTLASHAMWGFAIAFSRDGTQLASGDIAALPKAETGFTGEVKFWELRTGKLRKAVRGHTNGVLSLSYSPDGKRLASGSADGSVLVWEAATGQVVLTLGDRVGEVFAVTFSPDGTRLATAHGDNGGGGVVQLWEVASGKRTMSLEGHTGHALAVRFSPDGRLLASAGSHHERDKSDGVGEVRVWDSRTGEGKAVLPGGDGGTSSVAFSPDGTRLATAHGDGTVRVWSVGHLLGRGRSSR